jgi:hypothetical protein
MARKACITCGSRDEETFYREADFRSLNAPVYCSFCLDEEEESNEELQEWIELNYLPILGCLYAETTRRNLTGIEVLSAGTQAFSPDGVWGIRLKPRKMKGFGYFSKQFLFDLVLHDEEIIGTFTTVSNRLYRKEEVFRLRREEESVQAAINAALTFLSMKQ